jgi:hypothetical protein
LPDKGYLRDGVWNWPLARQREMLAPFGIEPRRMFVDELSANRARQPGKIKPEWLPRRIELLRPTGRTEGSIIRVPTILVLGVTVRDLLASLTAIQARWDSVHAADSGFVFPAEASVADVGLAIEEWEQAKRTVTATGGRAAATQAAADAKRKRTLAGIAKIKALWGRPSDEYSTDLLVEMSGLSQKTVYQELGPRMEAQAFVRRREAIRAKRRKV